MMHCSCVETWDCPKAASAMAYIWLKQRKTETTNLVIRIIGEICLQETEWDTCSVMSIFLTIVCSRWVSLLPFALVFYSNLFCVDCQGLEGINRQQHVSDVSLRVKKQMCIIWWEKSSEDMIVTNSLSKWKPDSTVCTSCKDLYLCTFPVLLCHLCTILFVFVSPPLWWPQFVSPVSCLCQIVFSSFKLAGILSRLPGILKILCAFASKLPG